MILLFIYLALVIISLVFTNAFLFISSNLAFLLFVLFRIWLSDIEDEKLYVVIPFYSLSPPIAGVLTVLLIGLFTTVDKTLATSILIIAPTIVLSYQLVLIKLRIGKSKRPLFMLNKVKIASGYSTPVYGILLFYF